MRIALPLALLLTGATSASADDPLEKQFFDYFAQRCEAGMEAEWKDADLDPNNPEAQKVMSKFCTCTSQAVVSFLSAEEIIAFVNNPEQEPAASKMRPHFLECHERARKKAGQG